MKWLELQIDWNQYNTFPGGQTITDIEARHIMVTFFIVQGAVDSSGNATNTSNSGVLFGADPDPDPDPGPDPDPDTPEPDIQCFGTTTVVGPLTVMETIAAQTRANSFDNFIAGLFGTAVGSLVSYVGGPAGGAAAAGIITTYLLDNLFDSQSGFSCGLIITTTTRMCTGPDISQMGVPALSDFWGDHILTVETSKSTGVCVNDYPSGGGGGVEP